MVAASSKVYMHGSNVRPRYNRPVWIRFQPQSRCSHRCRLPIGSRTYTIHHELVNRQLTVFTIRTPLTLLCSIGALLACECVWKWSKRFPVTMTRSESYSPSENDASGDENSNYSVGASPVEKDKKQFAPTVKGRSSCHAELEPLQNTCLLHVTLYVGLICFVRCTVWCTR